MQNMIIFRAFRSTNCRHMTAKCWGRQGLSLLEVILALALLAMSTAYLAQSMFLATSNALKASRLTQAELVAESVMSQVIAGVLPAQPVPWTPYADSSRTGSDVTTQWMYQIQSVPTEIQGMLGLQVAIQEVPRNGQLTNRYDFFANRWIIDPSLGLDVPPEEVAGAETGASESGSGSGASSTGSGAASGSGAGGAAPAGGGFGGGGAGGGGAGGGGRGGAGGAGAGGGGAGGAGGGRGGGGAGGGRGGAGGGGGAGGAGGGRGGAGGGGAGAGGGGAGGGGPAGGRGGR